MGAGIVRGVVLQVVLPFCYVDCRSDVKHSYSLVHLVIYFMTLSVSEGPGVA
jgi:hypothetical protein